MPEDVGVALSVLANGLRIVHSECATHSVLTVDNLGGNECLQATAVYLVSAIAQSIEANLCLREALFDEEQYERELLADVIAVIGEEDSTADFKTMVRDPWMWEGISHMLIHLSREESGYHPAGEVIAKTSIKYDVHDHGLDVIAIYQAKALGISAGECKAYFANPSRAISDASRVLGEVDSNKRDIEIRATVNQLRSALGQSANEQIAGSFWRDERCYLPFVCCDEQHSRDWNRKRKSLRRLAIPVSRKLLIPVALPNAREAFDEICSVMRAYAVMEES